MTGEWDKAYQFSRGLVVIYNYGIALKCCTVSLRFLYGVEFGFAVHDKPLSQGVRADSKFMFLGWINILWLMFHPG